MTSPAGTASDSWARLAKMNGGPEIRFEIETDREDDGRWIAEIPSLPGVMAYGSDRNKAIAAAEALALRVVADRLEHGELGPERVSFSFVDA